MARERKDWLALLIGYESDVPEDQLHQPPMQPIMLRYFDATTRKRWHDGGTTLIEQGSYRDDDWAKQVIDEELRVALATTARGVSVRAGTLRRLKPASDARIDTGTPGTRCVLVSDYWHNYRSYELAEVGSADAGNGTPWPRERIPADAMVFATLVWRCWPR